MSEEKAAVAAELPPVHPYEPEPENVAIKRTKLVEANKILNEKFAALGHFKSVFGPDSQEAAKAMEQVYEAQRQCNMATIDKDIVHHKHGLSETKRKLEEAKSELAKAVQIGDDEVIAVISHRVRVLILTLKETEERMHHRMSRYADSSIHEHVSEETLAHLNEHNHPRS